MSQNYKMILSYDGTRFFGWEHQPTTDMTIQGKLEKVLNLMTASVVEVIGCGRTDAGVHAQNMVCNARLDTEKSPEEIREYMNHYLPDDICIKDVRIASDRFHSRYNAVGKTYCYTCYIGAAKPVFDRKYVYALCETVNIEEMKKAAASLTGTHDYAGFCSNPRMKKTTVRTVDRIDIVKKGDYLKFIFHGNGFLQHMVRIMTGTLLEVGFGKRSAQDIPGLIAAKDRRQSGFTAPAKGLCLMKVDY